MPQVAAHELPEELLNAWAHLPPERRRSVVEFARFLEEQEASGTGDAEWERITKDEGKMATFQQWADRLLAESGVEPVVTARL
jgi:hypothetical protein